MSKPVKINIVPASIELTPEAKLLAAHIDHCVRDPQDLNEALLGVNVENAIKEAHDRVLREIEQRLLRWP